jgi:hypothetical protein
MTTDARLVWAVVVLSMTGAASEAAQKAKPKPAAAASQASGPDLFAGYSYTEAGAANLNGLEASASFELWNWKKTRLALELSHHGGSYAGADLGQTAFLAGLRKFWHSGKLSPFAQVLTGVARSTTTVPGGLSESTTGWGIAPGGGLDYRISRHWGARAQARLFLLHAGGVWDKDLGLAIGATYRLGH